MLLCQATPAPRDDSKWHLQALRAPEMSGVILQVPSADVQLFVPRSMLTEHLLCRILAEGLGVDETQDRQGAAVPPGGPTEKRQGNRDYPRAT